MNTINMMLILLMIILGCASSTLLPFDENYTDAGTMICVTGILLFVLLRNIWS